MQLHLQPAVDRFKALTDEEKAPLSEIIKGLNDRFGSEFTGEDQLLMQKP